MPSRRRCVRLTAVVLSTLAAMALATSCGDDDDTPVETGGGSASEGERDPDDVVVSIADVGAFMPAEASYQTMPSVVVYGDGRRLAPLSTAMIHPGPAVVSVESSQLSADQVNEIEDAARAAHLDAEVDYGQPPVADAGTTVVTVTIDGATYVHEAAALGIGTEGLSGAGDGGVTDAQVEAREELQSFVAEVGSIAGSDPEPYDAERFRLWVQPATDGAGPVDEDTPESSTVQWTVEGVVLTESQCVPVDDADSAAAAGALLADANSLTRFESAGTTWTVIARPVLPHETTCPE